MKSNKVLLGLFVGVFTLVSGSVSAQEGANSSRFFEVGPSNVAGRISSLAVDRVDTLHSTIYAGATSGGLYVHSDNEAMLRAYYNGRGNKDSLTLATQSGVWHYLPYIENGREVVLPVSSMVQGPACINNELILGTGTDIYGVGSVFHDMSVVGKGIFRYNAAEDKYTRIPGTAPSGQGSAYAAIHAVDYLQRDGILYLYAATNGGLYRWMLEIGADGKVAESEWSKSPEPVFMGRVDQIALSRTHNIVYFSSLGNLYMIADGASEMRPEYADISGSNSAFGGQNKMLKLALSPTDPSYLYVMVVAANGMMENIYLTRNMQTWTKLATSTVRPFSTNNGYSCGTICIDPANNSHVYVAGSTVYSGTGYVDGNTYQWMKNTQNEYELNYGDYMQYVYGSTRFVHSGIQQILPVYRHGRLVYYIATDGGVFSTSNFNSYANLNNGLNTMQVVSLDVAPDGSIVSGASANACQFIQSRSNHDGGEASVRWFDDGSMGNFNHNANIIWQGNGGHVAASMFQQIMPDTRRNIYVSSSNGAYGRAFDNYFNFTDNQVWTIDEAYLGEEAGGGPEIGMLYNWETDHDQIFNDSLTVTFDTLGIVMHRNSNGGYDSVEIGSSQFVFQVGDKITIQSRANSNYPFEYTFTAPHKVSERLTVKNPLQSRMLVVAQNKNKPSNWAVYMTWRASDFTKVYESGAEFANTIEWYKLFWTDTSNLMQQGFIPRTMTLSEDGTVAYIVVQDVRDNRSLLVRVNGLGLFDFTMSPTTLKNSMTGPGPKAMSGRFSNEASLLTYDTLFVDGMPWLDRTISSITPCGDSVILTFENYDANGFANMAIVKNAKSGLMTMQQKHHTMDSLPAYCAMVEKTTGDIYIGTAEGVQIMSRNGSWRDYEHLNGVPVTSIVQQKNALPIRRHIGHNNVDTVNYVYAKTKWPNNIYFGTFGRGIFMDMTYVTDTANNVADESDYVGIPTVRGSQLSSVSIYPNPVTTTAHMSLTTSVAGNAQMRIFDLTGRCVESRNLGYASEGEHTYSINTESLGRGMYLVNVIIGGHTATAKMMVR